MKLFAEDSAVSESLGFVIIAVIMMVAMSAVLMIGYPIYQSAINEGHMQNMEEGFYLFAANANKVALQESPIESSELKFYDGTLWLRNDGYADITYVHTVNGVDVTDTNHSSITVTEYVNNNNRISYIMGGVCKKDGNSDSIMIMEPQCYESNTASGTTFVMPYMVYTNANGAIGGQGLSRVTINTPYTSKMIGTLNYPNAIRVDNVKKITINMSSTYDSCFGRYFHDQLGFNQISPEPDKYILMEKDYSPSCTLYIIPTKLTINVE